MDDWKPSTGLGAVALALFVTAVTALAGPPHEMVWYGYLAGMVSCGTLALVHLGAAAVRAYLGIVAWQDSRQPPIEPPAEPEFYQPEPDPADAPVSPYPDRWATFWRRLAQAGDAYGWSQSSLTTEGSATKVMSEPAWNKTIPQLVEAGWLSGGPGRATRWAKGQGLAKFEQAEAWKALPHYPTEPPEIALPPYYTTAPQRTTAAATAKKRVIDGVRAD